MHNDKHYYMNAASELAESIHGYVICCNLNIFTNAGKNKDNPTSLGHFNRFFRQNMKLILNFGLS